MAAPSPRHDVFQAIADPSRRRMLRLLANEEMPVNVITGHFSMTRTAVSKHLRILSEAGLVEERKIGRETRYKFRPEPLSELQEWLAFFDQFWDDKLAMLRRHLGSESRE